MPRGKKKGGRRGEAGRSQLSDEENDPNTPDDMSTASALSEGSIGLLADAVDDGTEVDETSAQELFEEKLKDVIDATTQKSAKGRTEALSSLRTALSKKYIPEFVANRKLTISDAVERCVKKGGGEERAHAAACVVLLLIQIGAGSDSEEIYKSLRPHLMSIVCDASVPTKARSACAEALGLCSFIAYEQLEHVLDAMKCLEKVFRASYLKGDGSTPSHSPDVAHLHSSALGAWALLLSIAPTSVANRYVDSHLSKLPEILSSADVELRITAGETIALMYELAREDDEDFLGDDIDDLCLTLKQLATDSNKYRAKKDRRQQRSSFRDILATVEEGAWPSDCVRFSTMERLVIDSWVRKLQYSAFSCMLRSGTNVHLSENELLREIFGLGAAMPVGLPTNKATRSERHLFNSATFKARTKSRGKFRDKRAVTVPNDF